MEITHCKTFQSASLKVEISSNAAVRHATVDVALGRLWASNHCQMTILIFIVSVAEELLKIRLPDHRHLQLQPPT